MFNFRRAKKIVTSSVSKDFTHTSFVVEEGEVFGLFFVGFTRKIDHDTYSCDEMYDNDPDENDPDDQRSPIDRYNWLVQFINRDRIKRYKEESWDGVRLTVPIFPFRFKMNYRSLLGVFDPGSRVSYVEAFGIEFPDERCGGACLREHGKIVFSNGKKVKVKTKDKYKLTYRHQVEALL